MRIAMPDHLPTFRETVWRHEVVCMYVCAFRRIPLVMGEWVWAALKAKWGREKRSDRNGIIAMKRKKKNPKPSISNKQRTSHRFVRLSSKFQFSCSTCSFHSLWRAPILAVQCICSFASKVFRFILFTRAVDSLHLALFNLFLCFQQTAHKKSVAHTTHQASVHIWVWRA